MSGNAVPVVFRGRARLRQRLAICLGLAFVLATTLLAIPGPERASAAGASGTAGAATAAAEVTHSSVALREIKNETALPL